MLEHTAVSSLLSFSWPAFLSALGSVVLPRSRWAGEPLGTQAVNEESRRGNQLARMGSGRMHGGNDLQIVGNRHKLWYKTCCISRRRKKDLPWQGKESIVQTRGRGIMYHD